MKPHRSSTMDDGIDRQPDATTAPGTIKRSSVLDATKRSSVLDATKRSSPPETATQGTTSASGTSNRRTFLKLSGVLAVTSSLAGCDEEVEFSELEPRTEAPQTEEPRPVHDAGEASVVFFYMGDSQFLTLFQEETPLEKALHGYDRSILLKHKRGPEGIATSDAEFFADEQLKPTEDNFVDVLRELYEDEYTIDLFIFSHGRNNANTEKIPSDADFKMSKGTHGTKNRFSDRDIRGLVGSDGEIDTSYLPLRLVYQVNCWGSKLSPAWTDVGADVAMGPRYVNFYPQQFGRFADEWQDGASARDAYEASNTMASRELTHAGLEVGDSLATIPEWGGCPFGWSVMDEHECAKEYFVERWNHNEDEWTEGETGKWNMEHASEMLFEGDPTRDNSTYYNEDDA